MKRGLVDKSDISGIIDNSDFDKATMVKLKTEVYKITKITCIFSGFFRVKSHFSR